MVKFAYVITIQYKLNKAAVALSSLTSSGYIFSGPGETRLDLYARIRNDVCKDHSIDPSQAGTMFFYLEPAELNMADLTDLME
jgi:hypothetical protein